MFNLENMSPEELLELSKQLNQVAKAKKKAAKTKSMTLEAVQEWMEVHEIPESCMTVYTDKQGKKKIHIFLYTVYMELDSLEAGLQELGFVPSAFTRPEPVHNAVHGWAINLAKEAK